jgi:hypothetical protein
MMDDDAAWPDETEMAIVLAAAESRSRLWIPTVVRQSDLLEVRLGSVGRHAIATERMMNETIVACNNEDSWIRRDVSDDGTEECDVGIVIYEGIL